MNYLKHDIKVKYIDGLLAREQEWQWFVECIEKNYDMSDVNTWSEYLSKNNSIRDVYSYFVKIIEICDKEWTVKTEVLKEVIIVSKYYLGIVNADYCIALLKSNIGRLLFLSIWLTKLENKDNQTIYLADMRFFTQRNLWEILSVDSMELICDKIESYFLSLNIEGMDIPQNCVLDNINRVQYPAREGFIDEYRNYFLSANAFSYQFICKSDNMTWQEDYLLQMLNVSVDERKLKPSISIGDVASPDTSLWTQEVIANMKDFFADESAAFILENIAYIEHKVEPSSSVKLQHCRLLTKFMNTEEDMYEVIRCSSYKIISYMFEDKLFEKIVKEYDYIRLIQTIQNILDPHIIKHLREDKYPLSKEQKGILNEYYDTLAHQINIVKDVHTFIRYLENTDVPKRMDTNSFIKTCELFYKYVETTDRAMMVSNLFYNYMVFLMKTNLVATEVDKRIVRAEIINAQKVWQEDYYSKQVNNLHVFTHETKIATKDVENYNAAVLSNPILVAKNCMLSEEERLCKVMEDASEHAILYMFTSMDLSPVYPIKGDVINYERHDIDIMLKRTVEKIRREKAYKFLNVLDTDVYVTAIHKRYRELALTTATMFNEEEQVYHLLQQAAEYKLIPYEKNVTLAHLTQLFPLLEVKIRELASLVGIVPFKERLEDFMKYKDSSSVLRELLQEVYTELGSFENVPDLLFVYHYMYNGNSLNVRNECMHGRDYMNGSRLRFAFRLTLLAIYMIMYRIDVINTNITEEDDGEDEPIIDNSNV